MPQNKYAFARYHIIDRELSRKEFVKSSEIVDICRDEFGFTISAKQIQEDMKAMQYDSFLGYNAPIDYNRSKKAYYYIDSSYSITRFGLKEDEINTLQLFAGKLNVYKEYEIFKDFSNALEKVLQAVQIRKSIKNVQERQFIQTQNAPKCLGTEYIPDIITALEEHKVIEFEYQRFGADEIKKRNFRPYLLKEDSNRWYVIGKLKGKDPLTTFAIDRILSLKVTYEYFTPEEINFEDYFKYSFGIIVEETPPVEVVLSFEPYQGNYIKTLPLHHTQKILNDNNRELKVSVMVKPSYEFYSKILSFGKSVKVLSPKKVRREIKEHVDVLKEIYK